MKLFTAVVASLVLTPALAEGIDHENHSATTSGDEKPMSPLVQKVRKATARFRNINVAVTEGYAAGPCVSGPNRGAMGVHLINSDLLTKEVDADSPEALIYEPSPDGRMRLVGAPNRYGIPAF